MVRADAIFEKLAAREAMVTSINDKVHKPGSLHYEGKAFDLRTKDLPNDTPPVLRRALATALGPEFDVLLESEGTDNEHIHVEYDPAS